MFIPIILSSCGEQGLTLEGGGAVVVQGDVNVSLNLVSDLNSNVEFGATDSTDITITNDDENPIENLAANIEGAFSVTGTTCTSSLAPGESCTFTVEFTSVGATTVTEDLEITFDGGSATMQLSATGSAATDLVLTPVYSGNSNWMDYIKNDESNKDWYSQSNDACDGTENGIYSLCIHGGEKFQLTLTGVDSCNGLSATDALGAFNWECKLVSSVATIFSQGLKHGKGLADLIDFTSNVWLDNSITVTRTQGNDTYTAASTTTTKWHSNLITGAAIDAANSVSLTSSGTIYTIDSDTSTRSLSISGVDKVAVVVKKGAELTDALNSDGLVNFTNSNFGWVEGSFNGNNASAEMIEIDDSRFTRVHNVNGRETISATIYISGSTAWGNMIYNFRAHEDGNSDEIVWIGYGPHHNIFHKLYLHGAQAYGGFLFWGGSGNRDNTVSEAVISGGETAALKSDGSAECSRNTFSHFTIANYNAAAINFNSNCDDLTFNNFLLSNNATNIAMQSDATDAKWANIAIANGGTEAINLTTSTGHVFTENLLIGNNGASGCTATPGAGLDSNCDQEGTSNHNLITGLDLSASYFGKVYIPDTVNAETNYTATYNAITDFFNFENSFRAWGMTGSYTPDAAQRGNCSGTDTCHIWDFSLNSNDTQVLNRTNDGQNANEDFVAGAACPAAVHGNKALVDQQTAPNTFLLNANEILFDSLGDDDGLCESHEACIYSPNFGAYQGSGDYKAAGTCNFTDGTVIGVQMYAYPKNGEDIPTS